MKKLNFTETTRIINSIMNEFIDSVKGGNGRSKSKIENVKLDALINIYRCLPPKKQIYMQGELGNDDCITIIYRPADNHEIIIQSENIGKASEIIEPNYIMN